MSNPDYKGKFNVPVLYDKVKKTVVNNESTDILRMLNNEFNEFCSDANAKAINIYPEDTRDKIHEINSWVEP